MNIEHKTLPKFLGNMICKMVGIETVLEDSSLLTKRIEDGNPRLYLSNHISVLDAPILMKELGLGSFIAKSDIANWALIGNMARFGGTIFVEKDKNGQGIPNLHKSMTEVFNSGSSIIGFPEGTTGDGTYIQDLKKGLISIFHKNASGVKLEKEVIIQPLILKFTHVSGKSVENDSSLRDSFVWSKGMPLGEHLSSIFKQSSFRVEVRIPEEINPKDYDNYNDLTKSIQQSMTNTLNYQNKKESYTNPIPALLV